MPVYGAFTMFRRRHRPSMGRWANATSYRCILSTHTLLLGTHRDGADLAGDIGIAEEASGHPQISDVEQVL